MKNLAPRFAITVFISSSSEDEAKVLRKHVKARAAAHTDALRQAGSMLTIEPTFWEQVPPQQVTDGTVNGKFVRMAQESHCTLAILVKELRKGTREEIEAILPLTSEEVFLSILLYPPDGDMANADSELQTFIDGISEKALYRLCGDYQTFDALAEIDNLFVYLVARARQQPQGAYSETR